MSQQIPPPPTSPKRLRKGFLIIGLVLLIVSFLFFYGASRVNWDNVTTSNNTVSLGYSSYAENYPQWGYAFAFYVRGVTMQPNDVITVSYSSSEYTNETIRIVIKQYYPAITYTESILTSSDYDFLYFRNNKAYDFLSVEVSLVAQSTENVTLSTTIELHHYETPQWVYFGIGIVLSSLAMIPIFKSKK